jgi:hypothetical protein
MPWQLFGFPVLRGVTTCALLRPLRCDPDDLRRNGLSRHLYKMTLQAYTILNIQGDTFGLVTKNDARLGRIRATYLNGG